MPHAHAPALSSASVAPGRGGCASARHARRLWVAYAPRGSGKVAACPAIALGARRAAESPFPLDTNPGENRFRFDYSPSFLRWALSPPGFKPEWHVGVRVTQARSRAR